MDTKEEEILGSYVNEHWYYVSKGKALINFIGRKKYNTTLDVGAGSGVFSKLLIDQDLTERCICIDPNYEEERTEVYNNRHISFVRKNTTSNHDLILIMDVLEHVEDDAQLLRYYTNKISDSTTVLITVPAFQFLWSGHDVFLEHKRRYSLNSLTHLVESSGLVIERSSYFFGLIFPIAATMRLAKSLCAPNQTKSDLSRVPWLINSILIHLNTIEVHSIFRLNRIAGLSLFCLARRKS